MSTAVQPQNTNLCDTLEYSDGRQVNAVNSQSTTRREVESQQNEANFKQHIQKKKLSTEKTEEQPQNNKKFYIVIISIFFFIALVSVITYSILFKKNSSPYIYSLNGEEKTQNILPPSHFYTRHQHHAAVPAPSSPSSQLCNSLLPYKIDSLEEQDRTYYVWYGKVGTDIKRNKYDVGHFIERHVAVDGQCTDYQQQEGKTVFYDWDEVEKAFKQTEDISCPLSDRSTFSYDFQIKIANPSNYIKGIDCRTGAKKNFPKLLVLYRRAVNKPRPTLNQYLASNYVTIWTFYPKS